MEAQRNDVSSFFIVFNFFPMVQPPASTPLKSLPCVSGTLGVPTAPREAVAALSQSTAPARGHSWGHSPWAVGAGAQGWALRLLSSLSATEQLHRD